MEETYPKSFIVYLRLVDYLSGSRGVYCRRGVCSKNLGYVLLFFVCGNNLSSMGGEMKKRKQSRVGYMIKNWGMTMRRTNIQDFNYIDHDKVYRQKTVGVRTKVRITIEEI